MLRLRVCAGVCVRVIFLGVCGVCWPFFLSAALRWCILFEDVALVLVQFFSFKVCVSNSTAVARLLSQILQGVRHGRHGGR